MLVSQLITPLAAQKGSAEPQGVPSRRAALNLLHAVLHQGRPLDQALGGALGSLSPSDRGLAHAITLAVLRRLPALDAAIDSATPKPLPPDARARAVLRLSLAQAHVLGTPHHAVVATALPLVEGGPRRLVHGVLSRLLREGFALEPLLPEPWRTRWADAYGIERAGEIAAALAEEPPLDLTLRDAGETEIWAARLGATSLAPGHLRLSHAGDPVRLPGFAEGAWWVQDLAASLPARLLGPGNGRHALDLCAAPGGKTLQLAAAGWQVTALDISSRRLRLLHENLARTRLEAEVITADANEWAPPGPFDAILLDAPCSASGVARRHPDVLHLKAGRDPGPLTALQAHLAARAAAWVRPGGLLVYCTCSLEAEEGEAQAATLRQAAPWLAPEPISEDELPAGLTPLADGTVRTTPEMLDGGIDGFFIARFRAA